MNVTISPKKSFVAFPGVRILGQFVDGLGLTSLEERVQAIRDIDEPQSLTDLEHFLGVTGYLRDKIPRYADIAAPLQSRKTALLKGAPVSGQQRKNFAGKQSFTLTDEERAAFVSLKELICRREATTHADPTRPLYIDLDASAKAFGVMVYHLRGDD
jgi:hypothetical protein